MTISSPRTQIVAAAISSACSRVSLPQLHQWWLPAEPASSIFDAKPAGAQQHALDVLQPGLVHVSRSGRSSYKRIVKWACPRLTTMGL